MSSLQIAISSAAGLGIALTCHGAAAQQGASEPREARIPVGDTSRYARSIGTGQPLIVLHGGPDFDTRYLLPDLDRFSDAFPRRIADAIPGARLVVIPDCRHFTRLECAAEVRAAVNEFVSTVHWSSSHSRTRIELT